MVMSNQSNPFPKLKFGIDQILSQARPSNNHPKIIENSDIVKDGISQINNPNTTDWYKCYSPACTYQRTIYVPRPLRPYSNVVTQSETASSASNSQKRKRSWSRAVFSNLQRKGLEKRFQLQKYITKPDRRQLAATLGLTDAQVKVWFQNRRMKWRHTKEASVKAAAVTDPLHHRGSEHGKGEKESMFDDEDIILSETEEDIDVQT